MKSNHKYTKFYKKNLYDPSKKDKFTEGTLTFVDHWFGTIKESSVYESKVLLCLITDLDIVTKESCFK